MRIMYLLDKFPALSETFILNEITALLDMGHDVRVFSLKKPEAGPVQPEVGLYGLMGRTAYSPAVGGGTLGVFLRAALELLRPGLPGLKAKLAMRRYYNAALGKEIFAKDFIAKTAVARAAARWGIEHIHCHFASENTRTAFILNGIMGIPFTFTTHAYDIFIAPSPELPEWARMAKNVITISEFNRSYMIEKFGIPEEKIRLITCSIYVDRIKPAEGYNVNHLKIVSVSRLVEKKGYKYLIEACRILKEKGEKFTCEITGEGSERERLQGMIDSIGLGGMVRLDPPATRDEILRKVSSGSVFVLPCVQGKDGNMDGIPNVLMEAMALEIPVISTPIAGIPELIENGIDGILVPDESPEALAEAILRLKNESGLAERLRKSGRCKVEKKFNAAINVAELAEVFRA